MAKHRKTRQEKLVADHRHVTYHLDTNSVEEHPTTEKKTNSSYHLDIPASRPLASSYAYVSADLRKTGLITGAIIIAQIFLFIVINQM